MILFFFSEAIDMAAKAEYLVVDTGGFIKNDIGGLHSMADHIITLQEVNFALVLKKSLTETFPLRLLES